MKDVKVVGREVFAQARDVHPSARSEPDVLNRHPEIEEGISTLALHRNTSFRQRRLHTTMLLLNA